MKTAEHRSELAQRKYVLDEERSFFSRAHADVMVGLWAAGRLGLNGDRAKAYAAEVMAAGVDSPGGRGGFDKLVHDLAIAETDLEAFRARYAAALQSYETGHA